MIASLNVRICLEIDGFFALISMAHLSLLINAKFDRVYSNCFDIIMSVLYDLLVFWVLSGTRKESSLKHEQSLEERWWKLN